MLAFSLSSFIYILYNLLTIYSLTDIRQEQTALSLNADNQYGLVINEFAPAFSFVKYYYKGSQGIDTGLTI